MNPQRSSATIDEVFSSLERLRCTGAHEVAIQAMIERALTNGGYRVEREVRLGEAGRIDFEIPDLRLGYERSIRAGWFTGRETLNEKQSALDAFLNGETDVLVMSLRAGAGVDGLQHATDTVVFGELDWSPKIHDQCVTRVQRDGQTLPTVAYYTWTDAGADPIVLDVLGAKRAQSDPMFDTDNDTAVDGLMSSTSDRAGRLAEHVLQVGLFGTANAA